MKNKKVRRLLAGMLATTMILGSSMMSFAADTGTGTGTGNDTFEGHVDEDVISVALPVYNSEFNYILDPEGLIAKTEGAAHTGKSFEEGASVFFLSGDNTYTKESKKLKVINKGTVDVDVTVNAAVTLAETPKVAMSTTSTFGTDDDAAKIYLGLKVANQDTKAVTADTADCTVSVGLKGKPSNFEVKYAEGAYSFAQKDSVTDDDWNSFELGLEGACNTNGDWSEVASSNSAPVTVTWSFAKRASDSSAPLLEENAGATEEVTEAYFSANAAGSKFYFGITEATGDLESATLLSNVKLTNASGVSKTPTYSLEGQWGLMTWAQFEAAGGTWTAGETFKLSFTYNGENYEGTFVIPN